MEEKTRETRVSVVVWSWATALFCCAVLLPQGVGFKLAPALPNIDLPRLAMLALLGLFVFQAPKIRFTIFNNAPRTLTMLLALAAWQFLCAFVSASPKWSAIWAIGN